MLAKDPNPEDPCAPRRSNPMVAELKKVSHMTINPKSITKEELYGLQDKITGDWKEGLASHIIKS